MILINKIKKTYKNEKKAALNNVTITLPDKGLIFITGESGSGKSTLLNIIGGLDTPDSGNIIVDNKDISTLKDTEKDSYHKEYISYIYQQYNLIKHATIKDNITIFNANPNYQQILNFVGLSGYENKMVNELSGGEAQRVCIARALVKNSKIILCDEPTGALDDENGRKVMDILKKMSKERLIIVVTHNINFAKIYGDRIIYMQDGEIILDNKNNPKKNKVNTLKLKKNKYSFKNILFVVKSSLKYQHKRYTLMGLAISIGLISLFTVLSINAGFKNSIKNLEEETLGTYPLFISHDSINLEQEMSDIFTDNNSKNNDEVYVSDLDHKNTIDKDLLYHLDSIKQHIKYIQYNLNIDNAYISILPNNKSLFYSNFKLLNGEYPINDNEVLLVLDSHNQCDKYTMNSIGLNKKKFKYKDLIGYTYKLNSKKYKIVGIAKGLEETFYYDTSSIYYIDSTYSKIIPDSFYIFPKDKNSKDTIKRSLNSYDKNLFFSDYANTITNVSTTFIDAISLILVIFSIISLIVSAIMIAVITHINILERTKEIGILRSLGFSKHNIVSIFSLESLLTVFSSSIISILFVYILSKPFNKLVYNSVSLNNCMQINIKNIIIIILVGLLVGLIGSLKQARKTSKLKIIDTIRYE